MSLILTQAMYQDPALSNQSKLKQTNKQQQIPPPSKICQNSFPSLQCVFNFLCAGLSLVQERNTKCATWIASDLRSYLAMAVCLRLSARSQAATHPVYPVPYKV